MGQPSDGRPRTGFAPTVLAGLATAAVLAVCSARPWFHLTLPRSATIGIADSDLGADMPLALALSLVVLAAWGVVLVTRTTVRRVVLALGLLAAAGVLACLVTAPFVLPGQIRDRLVEVGDRSAHPTAAYVVACVAVLPAIAALALGWRLAPRWPTMSSRYDAPAGQAAGQSAAQPAARSGVPGDAELWKALDEGRDPTDPAGPPAP